ncbi:hypothetical protein DB88DRAFT_512346 [Papiliotrema laurentii]|uniref:Glycosyltransferase family 92 protein n=1 Tax=Papiliotrema laurentii TaxID=5418 RepID=A0AAD9CVG5_PAPLA|nr:hypothetical protein DB88DRAFT_512346 [Papiliotrema laurentii]
MVQPAAVSRNPLTFLLPRRRTMRRWTRDFRTALVAVLVTLGLLYMRSTDSNPYQALVGSLPDTSFGLHLGKNGLFPKLPADIPQPDAPPILVSRPNSSTTAFTRHVHAHPYPGTAYHFSSAIHPSKNLLDETHYLLGSNWYFEQDGNTDWMRIGVQGLLPDAMAYLSFTCDYAKPDGASETVIARTVIQGRNEYVHVECPLPSWTALDRTMSDKQLRKGLSAFSKGVTRINAWLEMGKGDAEEDPWLVWRNGPVSPEATIRVDDSTHVLVATQQLASADWTPSDPPNKLGVCLTPIRLQARSEKDADARLITQLKDFVEWRVWHRFGGVDVVHWSARDADFGRWVARLNALLGLRDTFLAAPPASETHVAHGKAYGDQAMYLADCLIRHGVTDEWLAMTDLDEYMLPRDDARPFGILRRLEALSDNIGTFSIDHTYYGVNRVLPTDPFPAPVVESFPRFPRNGWKHWDTLEKADGYRRQKSIYRSAAVKSIWVHSHTELGVGFFRTDDIPGIPPKGDYPSQLELLHDRFPVPPKLVIEREVDGRLPELWQGTWEAMAEVLSRPELEELWDVDLWV